MLFAKVIKLLTYHGRTVLFFALLSFAADTIVLSFCLHNPNLLDSLRFGFSRSAGCLLTVDSPNSLGLDQGVKFPFGAHLMSWLVSFFGWLLIPTLVGSLISNRVSAQEKIDELTSEFKRWGEAEGKTGGDLELFVEQKMKTFCKLAGIA